MIILPQYLWLVQISCKTHEVTIFCDHLTNCKTMTQWSKNFARITTWEIRWPLKLFLGFFRDFIGLFSRLFSWLFFWLFFGFLQGSFYGSFRGSFRGPFWSSSLWVPLEFFFWNSSFGVPSGFFWSSFGMIKIKLIANWISGWYLI